MCNLYNIKTLQVMGKTSAVARARIIDEFRASDRNGPRVLMLSSVGQTGLNLPCANIAIALVSSTRIHFSGFD